MNRNKTAAIAILLVLSMTRANKKEEETDTQESTCFLRWIYKPKTSSAIDKNADFVLGRKSLWNVIL